MSRHLRVSAGLLALVSVLIANHESQAAKKEDKAVRYVRYQLADETSYGILEGEKVRKIDGDLFGKWSGTNVVHPLNKVTLLVPSARPSKVLALAGNYQDHLGDRKPPEFPEPFIKLPSCLLRHEGKIIQPSTTEPVHFELEVVIVIGKRAKNVSEKDALDYVLGITCGNDISARYWQKNDVQWWRAKATDTFGPCGPCIVSGIDYGNLALELRVNGEVMQKSNTKNMIHNISQTVSFISKHVTLEPGDLIYTGTPGKTKGMQPGDVVEVEIEGVGILRNEVVAQ